MAIRVKVPGRCQTHVSPSSLGAEVVCLGVSADHVPRASGFWVSRIHWSRDRKEDNAAILGDHDRDGTILGSGWVGGDRPVRSGHIGGDRMGSKGTLVCSY